MTDRPNRLDDAAARLLDAVERLTGERAGELHVHRTYHVYERMAELIEREVARREALTSEHGFMIRQDVEMIRHALPTEAPDDDWPVNNVMCDSILEHAAALERDLAAVVAYARIVERYARASPLTPWIDGMRAEAGVQRIMEEARDGE